MLSDLNSLVLVERFTILIFLMNFSVSLASMNSKLFYFPRKQINYIQVNHSGLIALFVYIILFVLGLLTVDWSSVVDSYQVGAGFTLLFGSFYLMNYVLIGFYADAYIKGKKVKYILSFIFFMYFIFLALGVKQVVLWSGITLLLTRVICDVYLGRELKVNKIRILCACIIILIIAGVITKYRVNRSLPEDLDLFILPWLVYLWETGFTVLGGLNTIELVDKSSINLFPFGSMGDFFGLLIPSFFGDWRESIWMYREFSQQHAIETLGTNHLIGEIYLSTGNIFLFSMWFYCFSFIISSLVRYLLSTRNMLLIPLISYALVFVIIYPIRGGFYSGMKLFTSYGLLNLVFIIILRSLLSRIGPNNRE